MSAGYERSDTDASLPELKRRLVRVEIKNFKSIAHCSLDLPRLAVLVGPNASGKSNFLEAIEFVCECLEESVEAALRQRGGINEVQRKFGPRPRSLSVSLWCELNDAKAEFHLGITSERLHHFRVAFERSAITRGDQTFAYEIRNGVVLKSSALRDVPKPSRDRLYLMKNLGNGLVEEFVDFLSNLRFYNLNPIEMRDLQSPDVGDFLGWDGWNLASVWRRIIHENKPIQLRVLEYLRKIAPEVRDVYPNTLGPKETLRFVQEGAEHEKFFALNMSEGTIRAFAVLVALFQPAREDAYMDFVAIEEPEKAVHPAVLSVVLDAMREAGANRQIITTSHSPDLLDRDDLDIDSLIAVAQSGGSSVLGPVSDAGRDALREHLYTAGELLRIDHLRPGPVKT